MASPPEHSGYPTSEAQASLAVRFGLPHAHWMQDWEWQVAQPDRFNEFHAAYVAGSLTEAERWSLMEILIECVELSDPPALAAVRWDSLEPQLVANPGLHRETIEYWACGDASEPEECFRVTRWMRRVALLTSAVDQSAPCG